MFLPKFFWIFDKTVLYRLIEQRKKVKIKKNMSLGDEINDITLKIQNSEDFSKLRALFFELNEKWKEAAEGNPNLYGIILPTASKNFAFINIKLRKFYNKWEDNEIVPGKKQLEDAKKLIEFQLDYSSKADSKDFPADIYGDDYLSYVEKKLKEIKKKIEDGDSNEGLLKEIKGIEEEIKNTKKFSKLKELLSNIEEKIKEKEAEYNDEVKISVIVSNAVVVSNFKDFREKWEDGRIKPDNEVLKNAEKLVEVLLSNLSKFAAEDFPENIFGNKYLTSSQEFLNSLKGKIKEEKKKRPKDDDDTNLEEARKEILVLFSRAWYWIN